MNRFKIIIGGILLLFLQFNIQAQSIENLMSTFDGENITINYDLIYASPNQKFTVSIFSSHNNYQKPLTLVRGDYGENILAGKGKKIIWDVKNELPANFNDEISFKIKANFIALENLKIVPLTSNGFKKGNKLELKWKGGDESNNIKIELLKNDVLQQSITQTPNKGSYNWTIPKKQKTGSNYALRISSGNNANQKSTTSFFKIKPKIPLLAKIGVPIALAIAAVLVSGSGGGESESPTNNGLSELPGPITP